MRRRWKSITALCLSAMIGCVLPVGTMMAAEDTEAVDNMQEDEVSEPSEETQQHPEAEEPSEEAQQEASQEPAEEAPQEAEGAAEEEQQETEVAGSAEDEQQVVDTVEEIEVITEITPQAVETTTETDVQEQSDKTAPVIVIRLQETDRTQALGGKIEFDTYISNHDQQFTISVEQGSAAALYYYLDTAANASDESKSEEQLADLWQPATQVYWQEISLGQDGRYVLYAKAEAADGQTSCVRTGGIVIDATAPVITGIDNGGTYPAGTSFGVTDDNPDSVLINEQPAVPSSTDGTYQVAAAANSTSCVIRAKDKAGNETVYSITVEGTEPDIRYIWVSGSYALKAGRDYHLGYGNWTLDGDSTIYSGGITFYVKEDGSYQFTKMQ